MRFDSPVEHTHTHTHSLTVPHPSKQDTIGISSHPFVLTKYIRKERFTGEWINVYVNNMYEDVCIEMFALNNGLKNAFGFGLKKSFTRLVP